MSRSHLPDTGFFSPAFAALLSTAWPTSPILSYHEATRKRKEPCRTVKRSRCRGTTENLAASCSRLPKRQPYMQRYQPCPTTSARITISRADCSTPRARHPGCTLRQTIPFSPPRAWSGLLGPWGPSWEGREEAVLLLTLLLSLIWHYLSYTMSFPQGNVVESPQPCNPATTPSTSPSLPSNLTIQTIPLTAHTPPDTARNKNTTASTHTTASPRVACPLSTLFLS
jgi:hypothetical protein